MYKRAYDDIMREIFGMVEERLAQADPQGRDTSRALPPEQIAQLVAYVARSRGISLGSAALERLCEYVEQEFWGFGPLTEQLENPHVSEVMVNAPDEVWVEVEGRIVPAPTHFLDDAHVLKFARLIAQLDHRSCDTTHPLCDCMLNAPGLPYDRSRVNITLQPISLFHPTLTIRKFSQHMLSASEMVRMGSMDARCAELLEACVRGRMNMLVIGGTGSGKTSLLNVLSEFIPDDQRIITIEDTAELRLSKSNLITMQARKANGEGVGSVTVREIFQNALRQRPDRIIVGECRGGEVIDMLEAMSTGHDGSLTTLHANDARESVLRVDVLASMDGMRLPVQTVNEHFALAVDLIVTTQRLVDGSRKVVELMEVSGYDHETGLVSMAPLLKWKGEGLQRDEQGGVQVTGSLVATGSRLTPAHVQRLRANGVTPDLAWFSAGGAA